MKKLTLLIVLALFIQSTAIAQPCLPEGITFSTQTEIDNFQTNHPNCTEIKGDVTIYNISNLNGLSVLTSIGGNLLIAYTGLTSLTGMDNLISIGGSLSIGDSEYGGNPYLTSLTGLDNLTSIGGDIFIGSNNGDFDNPLLTNLTGLEGLTSIVGDLVIESNEALTSLTGLDNVTSIGGDLWVRDNDALPNFTGMENLSSIGGDILINTNNSLTSFTGLEGLTSLEGNLEIGSSDYNGGNNQLTSLEGLDNISANSITDLYIIGNNSLSSCEAQWLCDYLSNPNGSVNIYNNSAGCNNPPEVADACGVTLPCLPFGNYYFFTQSQIDNFATNYPDCTILEGDVEVGHWRGSDITNLNGLNVLTSIVGKLEITSNDALTTLTGLDNVTSIGGDLMISYHSYGADSSALTSLTGLEGLTSIGGDLHIGDVSWGKLLLTSLTGLDNVTSIGGSLLIEKCDALTSMTGLDNLTSIGGDLGIGPTSYGGQALADGGSRNVALTSLTGLDNLTSIGGGLRINDNDALTDLTGLDNLTSIGGDISLFFNDTLISLTGLDNVTSVVGNLRIYGNYALTNLTGLDNVSYIGGNLRIGMIDMPYGYGNPNLISLAGLQNVSFIGGDLIVGSNDALSSLTGLDNLISVEGNLSIGIKYYDYEAEEWSYNGNDVLTSLAGLDNLTSIGGHFSIYDNQALTSLNGLDNINANSITDLYITNNDSLSSCEVQAICNYLSDPNGTVNIYNNATGCNNPPEVADACGVTLPCLPFGNYYFFTQSHIDNFATNYPDCTDLAGNVTILGLDIINLNGLSVVTSIGGSLTIGIHDYGNPALTSLTGLDNLTSIGGGLSIYNNDALTSLTSLDNMTSIGGGLYIEGNHALTSLTGLDNIDSIPFLYITNNHSLSTCEVKSVCDYLASYNGYIYIGPNASGCNSRQEVEDACHPVSVNEINQEDKFTIFPNPSSTQITIELPNTPQKNALLTIYNMNAQRMQTSKITEQKTVVDISGLPNGFYFVKVADDRMMMVGKLVKK